MIFWGDLVETRETCFLPSDHYFLKFAGFLLPAKFKKHCKNSGLRILKGFLGHIEDPQELWFEGFFRGFSGHIKDPHRTIGHQTTIFDNKCF